MKRFICLMLAICVFTIPFNVHADELVKDVPIELKAQLGEQYILIDIDFFKEIELDAAKGREYFLLNEEMKFELGEFKIYSTRLERVIKQQKTHIGLLNEHIDYQEDVISNLAPTFWDKNKFAFGILLGGVAVGGMAYGLGQID